MVLTKSLPPPRDFQPMLAQAKYDNRTASDALWRDFPRAGVSCQGMPELRTCDDASAWDAFVSQAGDASVLQAWAWGSLKSRYGWGVERVWRAAEPPSDPAPGELAGRHQRRRRSDVAPQGVHPAQHPRRHQAGDHGRSLGGLGGDGQLL